MHAALIGSEAMTSDRDLRDLEVVRASLVYVRDMVDITRGDREPLDALIFTAALDANMSLVDRDAALHGAYGGAATSAPDHLRRPVSINAVAQSLRLPFETVRRRLLRMVRAGLCVIGPRGVVIPRHAVTSAAYAAEQKARFDRTREFVRALADLAATPAATVRAWPSSEPPSEPPVRAVNWAVSAYALRAAGGLVDLTGNVATTLVLVELVLASMRMLSSAALARWIRDPVRLGAPIRIATLSAGVRLPGETVRRHLHVLAARGFCMRRPDGFVATAPDIAALTLVRLAQANGGHLRRLFHRLDQLGVLAAWEEGRDTPSVARSMRG
jgi:DNA-binding IclR family transcriptional regulator